MDFILVIELYINYLNKRIAELVRCTINIHSIVLNVEVINNDKEMIDKYIKLIDYVLNQQSCCICGPWRAMCATYFNTALLPVYNAYTLAVTAFIDDYIMYTYTNTENKQMECLSCKDTC